MPRQTSAIAERFELVPRGPFTLRSAARFIAGWAPAARPGTREDPDLVRLAFLVDDWSGHAGVALRQRTDGVVVGQISADSTAADSRRVREQAARIISLDHDGSGYPAVGEREPLIGELQHTAGWLRPVLFHSPYEAACWGVISVRLRQAQAAPIRDRLSAAHGARLTVEGEELVAFPTPERLLEVREAEGVPAAKLSQLHAIARAAIDGLLDRDRLLALDPDTALNQLCTLPGIGAFWSQAILLRAVGPTDVAIPGEPRLRAKAAALYGVPEATEDDDAFLALAERWRPFRTWVSVLVRSAG